MFAPKTASAEGAGSGGGAGDGEGEGSFVRVRDFERGADGLRPKNDMTVEDKVRPTTVVAR